MDDHLLALLVHIAENEPVSTSKACKHLGLSLSQLKRLLVVLGDDVLLGGLGLVRTQEDGRRTMLELSACGRTWFANVQQGPAPARC